MLSWIVAPDQRTTVNTGASADVTLNKVLLQIPSCYVHTVTTELQSALTTYYRYLAQWLLWCLARIYYSTTAVTEAYAFVVETYCRDWRRLKGWPVLNLLCFRGAGGSSSSSCRVPSGSSVRWLQSQRYALPRIGSFFPLRDLREDESRRQTLQASSQAHRQGYARVVSVVPRASTIASVCTVVPSPVLRNPYLADLTVSWSS